MSSKRNETEKAVVFGAKGTGMRVCESLQKAGTEIVCFVDNDEAQWGEKVLGIEVKSPESLKDIKFDRIYCGTLTGKDEIEDQLVKIGISRECIDKTYANVSIESRKIFLRNLASEIYLKQIPGSVAEAGVYRGEFAKQINSAFPDRTCYLFDTFEGFDKRDFEFERKSSLVDVTYMNQPNVDMMLQSMPHRDKIVIRKGYFPETADDIEEMFVFVNLDMDLYMPTLNGIRKFYPLMAEGGVILIHDYFSSVYPNVRQAVEDYEKELGEKLYSIPIGDDLSIAIIKSTKNQS